MVEGTVVLKIRERLNDRLVVGHSRILVALSECPGEIRRLGTVCMSVP